MTGHRHWSLLTIALLVSACDRIVIRPASNSVYTLYRSSLAEGMRIKVATFDSDESIDGSTERYNRDTCEEVRALEQESVRGRPVELRYWCEKGYYRK